MVPPARQTHYGGCNLCEAMCGLVIETEAQTVLSIRGDGDDPLSRGYICPKAVALRDIQDDPDRLRYPQRRTESGWHAVSWDDAFDEVAERLLDVQEKYGRDAVAVYQGNPTVHNMGTLLSAPQFVRALKTRNRYSATSVDQLPHQVASFFMFGHQLLLPIPDIDRTDFFLILGANPLASNGSMMTAPGFEKRLKRLQQRGAKFVVLDPRRTATADLADAHHFIRPGTDVLLLLALVHTVLSRKLHDLGTLSDVVSGMDELQQHVEDFPPQRVAAITGIPANTIERLAVEFATARSAVCYGRLGVSTQEFGALNQWLIYTLNTITGNLDRAGGAMFTNPAVELVTKGRRGSYDRWRTRVRGAPEFAGELPVACMAEEMLTEGDGQIRALVTSAGNPVLSAPNGRKLERGLAQLDFMVSVDIYVNETTRYANVILPPTCGLETSHYDLVFHALAVRNTARFSAPLLQPAEGTKQDWQIFDALRRRIEAARPVRGFGARLKKLLADSLSPDQKLDLGLRIGPYGAWGGRKFSKTGLTLSRLRRHPHGIDFGPLRECLPQRLFTKDRKIQLTPAVFVADLERVRAMLLSGEVATEGKLALIGRRDVRSNNSWMHNVARLVRGRNRCTILLHPDDAKRCGITDGEDCEVRSAVGAIRLPAEITDSIMAGTVSIPHGWGHGGDGVELRVALDHAGASINHLTDDARIDAVSGNAAFSGVEVVVGAVELIER